MLPPEIAGKEQAQRWLDDLPLPKEVDLDVRLESLEVGAQYFQKITLGVSKGSLETFAAYVRSIAVENGNMAAATSWAKEFWAPHVSLMYADIEVTAEERQEILHAVTEAGIRVGKQQDLLKHGKGEYSGWNGGRIALVEVSPHFLFGLNIESRDTAWEYALPRSVSKPATPPQLSKTDSGIVIQTWKELRNWEVIASRAIGMMIAT